MQGGWRVADRRRCLIKFSLEEDMKTAGRKPTTIPLIQWQRFAFARGLPAPGPQGNHPESSVAGNRQPDRCRLRNFNLEIFPKSARMPARKDSIRLDSFWNRWERPYES